MHTIRIVLISTIFLGGLGLAGSSLEGYAASPVPQPAAAPSPAPSPLATPAPLAVPDAQLPLPKPAPKPIMVKPLGTNSAAIAKDFTKECSACHVLYVPRLLPAASWTLIMNGLDKHFGENASLDTDVATNILSYLAANSADSRGGSVYQGISADKAPLRITTTFWWERIHGRMVQRGRFNRPGVKSKSNCIACHKDAARGRFGDD